MKRIVDGEWLESAEPMEELPLGAEGVFETILLRHGTPLFWAEHWQRFEAGCRFFGFAPPIESTSLAATAARLAKDNGIANGVIRFAAWKTVVRGLPPSPRLRKTGRTPPSAVPGADARSNSTKNAAFATAGYGDPALQEPQPSLNVAWRLDVGPPRPHMSRVAFRVGWGATLLPPTSDRAYKHLQRDAWLDALRTARASGLDEVILCNTAGAVVEGGVSNVFFVRNGVLFTPGLALGPLPGVMRGQTLAFARAAGISIAEGACSRHDLEQATEVWLTNSLLGLRPVVEFAGRQLAPQTPVLDRFRAAWRERHGWDPVVVMP